MKKLILVLLALSSGPALARDSLWTLCEGKTQLFGADETILVNQYEHRSGADSRTTQLTLIFGGHLLSGSFDSTSLPNEVIVLTQGNAVFVGRVRLAANTLELNGNLSLVAGSASPLVSSLTCRTIRD